MKRKIVLYICIVLVMTCNVSVFSSDINSAPNKRVLVISSVISERHDLEDIMEGIDSTLLEAYVDVLDVNEKYLENAAYQKGLNNTLSAMIESGGDYDLVITIHEPATQFILNSNILHENTKVLYAIRVHSDLEQAIQLQYDSVGILEPFLFRENLILAENLFDGLNKIVVVADNSQRERILSEIEREKAYTPQAYSCEVMTPEAFMNLTESDTQTLFIHMSQKRKLRMIDGNEKSFTTQKILMNKEANIIGGRVFDSKLYGETIGKTAVRILNDQEDKVPQHIEVSSYYLFHKGLVQKNNLHLGWISDEVTYLETEQDPNFIEYIIECLFLLTVIVTLITVILYQRKTRIKEMLVSKQQDMSQYILDYVDTGISIKDQHRRYVSVNEPFKKIFGIDGDIDSQMDYDLFSKAIADEIKMIDDRAMYGSQDYEKNIVYHHKTRGSLFLNFKVVKTEDVDSKENVKLITYINDLTEQKKHEKTLAELNKILEQKVRDRTGELIQAEKMAVLGTLVAGISHEINTPIGVSITASTYLTEQSKQLKKQFENGQLKKTDMTGFLEMLEETSTIIYNNLSNAAEQISNFKKIAVDQDSEDIREFNLKEYLESVAMNLKPKFKHTLHKIHVIGEDDIKMYTYPGAVNQIFTNLILNSLIHGFEGIEKGEITIDVQRREDILGIRIDYKDNGCGIPKEEVAKIFDPYYTTKRGAGGSGLGMSIVENLIEKKLHGTIKVYSDTGQGVRFVIDFPTKINVYDQNVNVN